VILCPECRKPFHASASRGKSGRKYPAYHCKRTHERVGIDKATFESVVQRFVNGLWFDPNVRGAVIQGCHARYRERQEELRETHTVIARVAADLEAQKAEAVRAFLNATSDAMRKALEAEVERLEREIANAVEQRTVAEVSKADLDSYLEDVREVLEHPHKLLENPANMQAQRNCYLLVFSELPTISELDFGTPKLSPIFRACLDQSRRKSRLAGQPRVSWNRIASEVARWKARQLSTFDVKCVPHRILGRNQIGSEMCRRKDADTA
jgi:hypothetical protein